MRHLALISLIALAPSIPRPSGACSPLPEDAGPYQRDPAHASDTTPPSAPTVTYTVYRADPDDGGGCGVADSCGGGFNMIQLRIAATDNRAPADLLGVRYTIVGGQPPPGYWELEGDRLMESGALNWRFDSSFRSGFSFDVEFRMLDLNGNLGPPVVVTVSDGPG